MNQFLRLIMATMILGFLTTPAFAQETMPVAQATPTPEPIESDKGEDADPDEVPDEEPDLPEDMIVLPEEDPNTQPAPLEEEFFRMLPVDNPWFWRAELRNSTSYQSNVDQIADAPGGVLNNLSATGLLRYTLPSNTQFLLRSQHFLFNYLGVQDPEGQSISRDRFLSIPLSPTVTQWFGDSFNLYTSYLPIFSSSIGTAESVQRLDHDLIFGGSYYHKMGQLDYLFVGYQLDTFFAQDTAFSNLGNLFFAGYRHGFNPDLYLFADLRAQPRNYFDSEGFLNEMRVGGSLALQWHVLRPWLIIEGKTDYNQIMNFADAQRSAGIFSVGINLISAIQSN